jgi:hypothetical protein
MAKQPKSSSYGQTIRKNNCVPAFRMMAERERSGKSQSIGRRSSTLSPEGEAVMNDGRRGTLLRTQLTGLSIQL